MIKRRTRESFKVERRYADVGLKAALAVQSYSTLGQHDAIEAEDLCAAFARIGEVTFEQAWAITNLVLEAGDTSSQQERKRLKRAQVGTEPSVAPAEAPSIDFGEFLVASHDGQMMTFDELLSQAPKLAQSKIDPSLDKAKCEAAFLAARGARKGKEGASS